MKDENYIVNEDLIQIGDKLFILNWEIKNKNDYKYRVKNSKGQIVELEIWVYYSDREQLTEYLSVTLSVNKKRKGYEYGKETGKAGIESLLIAKKILQYHIDKVLKRQRVYKWTYYIIIWWDDSRRRDVYYRGLKDLGFEFSQYGNKEWNSGKCLVLKI